METWTPLGTRPSGMRFLAVTRVIYIGTLVVWAVSFRQSLVAVFEQAEAAASGSLARLRLILTSTTSRSGQCRSGASQATGQVIGR